MHAVFRDQRSFKAAAALVPVTNLVFRLSFKGPRYAERFVRQKRIGGEVHERRRLYIERSPLYQIDRLQTPLLVHVADNDRDVDFVEAQQLIHALEYKKPRLAETRVYVDPPVDELRRWPHVQPPRGPGARVRAGRQPRAARLLEPHLDVPGVAPGALWGFAPDPRQALAGAPGHAPGLPRRAVRAMGTAALPARRPLVDSTVVGVRRIWFTT